MLNTGILFIILTFIIVYEVKIHRYYKNDLKKETLISNFSFNRMQLIKMVYMNELDVSSNIFKFMMKTSSYSIRALYFYKNRNKGIERAKILEETVPILLDDKTKDEFENLNNEQKKLVVKSMLNTLLLYTEENYLQKLFFKMYLKQIKRKTSGIFTKFIQKISSDKVKEQLSVMDKINTSYSVSEYAYAY